MIYLCIRNPPQLGCEPDIKNGCHDVNRDFVGTKMYMANIVTSILIS